MLDMLGVALMLLKLYPDDLFHEASYGEINSEELNEESNKFSTLVSLAKFKLNSNFPKRRFFQPTDYLIYSRKFPRFCLVSLDVQFTYITQ